MPLPSVKVMRTVSGSTASTCSGLNSPAMPAWFAPVAGQPDQPLEAIPHVLGGHRVAGGVELDPVAQLEGDDRPVDDPALGQLRHHVGRVGLQRAVLLRLELELHQALVDVDADLLVLLAADVGRVQTRDVGRDRVDEGLGPGRRGEKQGQQDGEDAHGGPFAVKVTGSSAAGDRASDVMAGSERQQRRLGPAALRLFERAAADEAAGVGRVDRAADLALQAQPRAPHAPFRHPLWHRRGRQQRPRVGMHRGAEHVRGRPGLDDAAEIHHRHTVRHVPYHLQIVGDEQIGETQLTL